jgi:hypothetical protein
MSRCTSMCPPSKTTKPEQCQRPEGHTGDHVAIGWSGTIKIYPTKWTDKDVR